MWIKHHPKTIFNTNIDPTMIKPGTVLIHRLHATEATLLSTYHDRFAVYDHDGKVRVLTGRELTHQFHAGKKSRSKEIDVLWQLAAKTYRRDKRLFTSLGFRVNPLKIKEVFGV